MIAATNQQPAASDQLPVRSPKLASGYWRLATGGWLQAAWADSRPPLQWLLVAALWLLPAGYCPLWASGEADAFALPGVGARPAGMGGAFIGLSDDIESVYYNPSGLGNLIQSGVSAMYQTPSLETSRGFLAFNKRWVHPRFPGSFGGGWLRLRSSDIELTSADEQVLGTDTLTNDLVVIAAGVHPFEHWSFGAGMKYHRFAFNGFSESGFGADLGVHAQYNPLRFGLVLTDVGGTTLKGDSIDPSLGDAEDKIPMRLRTGLGVVWRQPFNWPITLALDSDLLFKLQDAQDLKLFHGVEVWTFEDHVAARAGYQSGLGPTIGFGARVGWVQLDYAFLFSLHLRDEHRIGTTVRF